MRVVLHGASNQRPPRGAESSDLLNLAMNHWAIRNSAGPDLDVVGRAFGYWPRSELLQHFDFYPPLWYGGVAGLFASQESLSYPWLIGINAVALAVALWAGWDLARRTTGATSGLLAVVVISALPIVAGRMTFVGVEPSHMAILALSLRALVLLREPEATWAQAALLGGFVGAGMLMKWTFFAPLIGPVVLEGIAILRAGSERSSHRRRFLLAGGGAGLIFSAWFVPFADLQKILGRMGNEATNPGGLLSQGNLQSLFPFVEIGLGWAGLALALLAGFALAWEARRGDHQERRLPSVATLLASSTATLILVHFVIPHKELRYFVPAGWSLGLMIALGLSCLWNGEVKSGLTRAGVVAGLLWLSFNTFLSPHREHLHHEVRLTMDHRDYGFGDLTELPPVPEGQAQGVVIYPVIKDGSEVGATIAWEFTTHNKGPILVQICPEGLFSMEAQAAVQHTDYLVTNRILTANEGRNLRDRGLSPSREVTLDLDNRLNFPGPKDWTLWARSTDP